MTNNHLTIDPEVQTALAAKQPVVALESTLISHGLPAPHNIETALAAEQAVRAGGAIPATIAVIAGELRIGLDKAALELLASAQDVAKLSRRDLALCIAQGRTGATTVAGTMIAAHAAGIQVFATGGIGGVHPGAELSFDVSADLAELARTPLLVVCSGAKAILDLARTRELLETLGVSVLGYRSDFLPGFWSHATELPVDQRIDDLSELAAIVTTRQELRITSGMLLCNPLPPDRAIAPATIAGWVKQAQTNADQAGIAGKDLTPYLLAEISQLSDGVTLKTNIELIVANAGLAATAAAALTP